MVDAPCLDLFDSQGIHEWAWAKSWRRLETVRGFSTVLSELHISLPCPLFPTEGYDAASEKIGIVVTCRLLFASFLDNNIISSTVPAVDLPSVTTLVECLSRSLVTYSRDHLSIQHHRYLPSTLMNGSIPTPYAFTVIDKCRVSTLTSYLRTTLSSTDLHHNWLNKTRRLAQLILRCDEANRENTTCSVRYPLRGQRCTWLEQARDSH